MTLDQLLVIGAGVLWVVTVHCAHSSGLRQDRDQGFAEGHKEGLTQGRLEGYRPSIPPMTESERKAWEAHKKKHDEKLGKS